MFRTFKALKSFVTPLLSYSAILVFNSLTHFSSWVPHVLVHNLNGDGSQGRRILLSLSLCFTRASETASWLPFLDVVFHLLVQEEARRISCRLLDENYILTKMYCLCCCSFFLVIFSMMPMKETCCFFLILFLTKLLRSMKMMSSPQLLFDVSHRFSLSPCGDDSSLAVK